MVSQNAIPSKQHLGSGATIYKNDSIYNDDEVSKTLQLNTPFWYERLF
jgi:hypothetical protein